MTSDNLTTIFRLSGFDYCFFLDEEENISKNRFVFVMDLMKVPGFEDVYGLLFQGQKMTIFKDVLIENGVMWYELEELKQEYLRSQRERLAVEGYVDVKGLRIGIFGYRLHKRSVMAVARYLKSEGAIVALFVGSLRMREYKTLTREVEIYCPEVLL